MRKQRLKIAIITSSLGGGGAQKSSANLSFVLSKLDYDVHIISILNQIDYEYQGKLLNLGKLKDQNDSIFGKIKRFRLFYNYLKSENFDYIIDSRARPTFFKQLIVNTFLYQNHKVIYIIHNYFLKRYLPSSTTLAKLLYGKANKLVCVSKEIENLVVKSHGFKNITTIYNPVVNYSNEILEVSFNLPQKFILYFGRINDKVKNISLLIDGYNQSKLARNNTKLVILGDGPDITYLKQKTVDLQLQHQIVFLPYCADPSSIMKRALFSVLSSRYEGFPMVLIESLSFGIPVVSVDCKSGPSEVINHKKNGLLVDNHNPIALADAFNEFIENKKLYNHCKEQAKQSVEKFSADIISKSWLNLLK